MKNRFKILYVFLGLALLFTACTPTDYELGGLLDKSALKFSVTQDAADPNMIILKSLTPGVTPQWITPLGRSTRMQDTCKIPFSGTYRFIYGVESAGGLVQADTLTVNITTNNLSYVNDPLWTKLSGGVGNSKTWYLDLNASAVSKYFAGPLYFYGTNDSWESVTNGVKVGGDSWNWSPDYPGNSWLMGAADFGSMTFDLKNGAHATINHLTIAARGTEHGTYMLDQNAHTLKITDAAILHDSGRDGIVTQWGNCKVLSLTENTMQLAVLRDNSSEGKCLLVYNFISKPYSDSWTPKVVAYAEPIKTGFTKADLVGTWKYNTNSQNWIGWEVKGSGKGGSLLNNWTSRAGMVKDLTGWGAADAATTFANADANLYIFNADGTCSLNGIANTYTVTDGSIAFGTPLAGTEWSLVWISLSGSSVNVLNVTSIGTAAYTSNGIWLGTRNGTKNEDQAIQLVKQ
jgi:hypothetical protein